MTITLSDLCRGLAETIHTVEYYSDTGVELWYDLRGGIDLSSDRMRRLFHAMRIIRPMYFRLAQNANLLSLRCVVWNREIKLCGYLYQTCDEFMLKTVETGLLSKSRLDLECALSGLN